MTKHSATSSLVAMLIFNKNNLHFILLTVCFLSVILILQSCGSTPEYRPKAFIDAEYYLQQGTIAYRNDEYPVAANNFVKALEIYQSTDNYSGIIESNINLIETAIAIGNFASADQQLNKLADMADDNAYEPYSVRIDLLRVKRLFSEVKYSQALAIIKPLLPLFDEQQHVTNSDKNSLNIISSMTRLSLITDSNDDELWLQRYQLAITNSKNVSDRHKALLFRLQALQFQKQAQHAESKNLLNKALEIYRQQAYRRGIAACLQQLAQLERELQHWELADDYLQRALKIYLWILNQRKSVQVLEQLIEINNLMGRKETAQNFSAQLDKLKNL